MIKMVMNLPTHLIIFIVFVVTFIPEIQSICSNAYGSEPCNFIPAPPGKTPPCAQPGATYCEYPDRYPSERIQYLLQKWQYDFSTLLRDETQDEFSTYSYPPPIHHYGPYDNGPHFYHHGGGGGGNQHAPPEPIHIPKPMYTFNEHRQIGNSYIPPKIAPAFNYSVNPFLSHLQQQQQGRVLNYKYSRDIPPLPQPATQQQSGGTVYEPIQALPYPNPNYFDKLWSRKDDLKYGNTLLIRKRRSDNIRQSLKSLNVHRLDFKKNQTILQRSKRQNLSGEQLCQTRTQYITPRAALNNKGSWKYIVNMPEANNSQLVKSEVCASQTCSGLCSIPTGYTARCEQKHVQKRLVALDDDGNKLYTDVFWFPSCCICTISNS